MIISHVIVAEFDIDKGNTLSFQHPKDSPLTSDTPLADLMLPDGAHAVYY
jgi:hypothetical protein